MTDEQFQELIATLTYIGDELSDIALQTRGIDDYLEKIAEKGDSIASSLQCIEYNQKNQVELLNGGFGFVKDISKNSDSGGAVYELMDSFNSKMQELINVITRK
jgi:conjugal transfer/entry exclusion protein